jgi:hypothetical protein
MYIYCATFFENYREKYHGRILLPIHLHKMLERGLISAMSWTEKLRNLEVELDATASS